MKKFKVLICLLIFCLCFLGIDSVKADVGYCSTNDKFESAASCDYDNPEGIGQTAINVTLYFGKTTTGKYCAEIKNIKMKRWADFLSKSVEQRRKIVAFDLNNNTMKDALNNSACPKLKFVNDYDLSTSKTVKFTASDKGVDGLGSFACGTSQIVSFGSECWMLEGKNWNKIASSEMENTVEESEQFRDDEYNQKQIEKIKSQARKTKEEQSNPNYNISENEQVTCSDLLGAFAPILKNLFFVVCVIGIIILVFTMSGDFIKAITSGDSDALPVAFKNSSKRIAATIILLLLPIVLNFVIDIINNNIVVVNTDEGVKGYRIGNLYDCKFTLNKDGQIVKRK